jgi:hypothetical protein
MSTNNNDNRGVLFKNDPKKNGKRQGLQRVTEGQRCRFLAVRLAENIKSKKYVKADSPTKKPLVLNGDIGF